MKEIASEQLEENQALIEECLRISFPAWPLQNTVAVNPFWFMRERRFEEVLGDVAHAIHTPLLMSMQSYQDLLAKNEITLESLTKALTLTRTRWPHLPERADELWNTASLKEDSDRKEIRTFAEHFQNGRNWLPVVVTDIGKYAAAYLDDNQALAPFPWKNENFWKAWLEAQKLDQSMQRSGINGFQKFIEPLRQLEATDAISFMLCRLGLVSKDEKGAYLNRLMASVLGWASQFRYLEWQTGLGYLTQSLSSPKDLLAVRLAYDFALLQFAEKLQTNHAQEWRREIGSRTKKKQEDGSDPHFQVKYVFQLAWELEFQKKLASMLQKKQTSCKIQTPQAQMVFCIDVRSEMIRRHIEEQTQGSFQTIGFAGFFGIPFDYKPLNEKQASHRLPVLLKPALKIEEQASSSTSSPDVSSPLAASYFRNLRKNTLSSFAYVELFGALYIEKVARRAWITALRRLKSQSMPKRFSDHQAFPDPRSALNSDGTRFAIRDQVLRAAAVLRHLGLTSSFSPLVVFVGHGSATTNNAFGSALDCGACGGHAGDINARVLTRLLNDPEVRQGLRSEQIDIPESTWFLAAIHETVTDEIYPLDVESMPAGHRPKIAEVLGTLKEASLQTRIERQGARSNILDPNAIRRSHNWSEVRPEWGLAGNACFIVAPRTRTIGVNLSSRSFLHDYDWKKDESSGYQTLELIMTAPMVVTNWINLQYYASTVAPDVYGAGNKVLHNLVNESGVFEGNGGDLRVGLPLQSLHDGTRFVHEPLRLSVLIEAPREQIETIIEKHQIVRELVDNEWLHLLHIDPLTSRIERRSQAGQYVAVQ